MSSLRPAATILLVRDGAAGPEVAMIVRHQQIDFASGALVFPGGSVDAGDGAARAVCDGAGGLSDEALAFRVAAIREAFEECGVLLARRNGAFVPGQEARRLSGLYRADLEARRIGMADIATAEDLTLATDAMAPFAHWVTPAVMKKRFDTQFFIARAPEGHDLVQDGAEAVDALWIRPAAAVAEADAGTRTVVFATRLNLELAAEAADAADAIARAAARKIVRVEPDVTPDGDARILRIPPDAGYGASAYRLKSFAAQPEPLS